MALPNAYALAYPLLLTPSGAKFGKSEGGDSVWLHPDGTSPYAFYQHWLNTDDRDIADLPALVHAVRAGTDRGARGGDRGGAGEARGAARARVRHHRARPRRGRRASRPSRHSEAAFSGPSRSTTRPSSRRSTARRAASRSQPRTARTARRPSSSDAGVLPSRGEARRLIQNGGLTINGERVTDAEAAVPPLVAGEWLVVRVGKRQRHIGRRRAAEMDAPVGTSARPDSQIAAVGSTVPGASHALGPDGGPAPGAGDRLLERERGLPDPSLAGRRADRRGHVLIPDRQERRPGSARMASGSSGMPTAPVMRSATSWQFPGRAANPSTSRRISRAIVSFSRRVRA